MRGFLFALVIALASCSPAQSIPVTQGVPFEGQDPGAVRVGQMWPSRVLNSAAINRWIYVADGKAQALAVYRFGYTGSPVRTVKLDGAGFADCTDDAGRAYVTELLAGEVQVFNRGAVRAIGKLRGLVKPNGIACANGKVYVADDDANNNPAAPIADVMVYNDGSMDAASVIPVPAHCGVNGVAVDASGNVFETVMGHCGLAPASLFEYVASTHTFKTIAGLGTVDRGVSMDGRGNVVVGNLGKLTTFVAPDFERSWTRSVRGSGILGFFTHDRFATYVPLNDGAGKSEVLVYPSFGSEAPYALRAGLETPQGAAGGP